MSDSFIPSKDKYAVTITFDSGDVIGGYLFVQSHERLIDVMNDSRQFLPFETDGDVFYIVNKMTITKIETRIERSASKLVRPTVKS